MSVSEAFFSLCREAQPAEAAYVSLYRTDRWYGGPEEGGWWGSDDVLVAYHRVGSMAEAEAVQAEVRTLAEQLSRESKTAFQRQCAADVQWLEARGLDDSVLREVDGESSFWVAKEAVPGSFAHEGQRGYS